MQDLVTVVVEKRVSNEEAVNIDGFDGLNLNNVLAFAPLERLSLLLLAESENLSEKSMW